MTERDIFLALVDLPDPKSRNQFLDQICHDNPDLRARVEALLRSHDNADSFLDHPFLSLPDSNEAPTLVPNRQASPIGNRHPDEALPWLEPSTRPDALGRLHHYEILQILGRGAFGIVFRAFDEKLHRMVAVKVLNTELADNAIGRKRFIREARAAAAICHEHVVNVHAVDEQPVPHLVMECVCGQTLQEKLDRNGPLEVQEVLRIGQQIAEGLAAAHAIGLIHRDIKPANILLEQATERHVERVKISDFGLARAADDGSLTQSGVICGTPMYMAPEQAQEDPIDHRTDLFSLGSVMYVMCTGLAPFRADSTLAVLKRVCEATPRPIRKINPDIPSHLCDIITRLHQKKPDDRFSSAREVADLLAQCQQHGQVHLKTDVLPSRHPLATSPSPRKHRWASMTTSGLVAVVLGLVGLIITETYGVTNVRATVLHLFSADGTLVIEVDDPTINVTVDGEEILSGSVGVKEIRLKPGQYQVRASKEGKTLREELVTIEHNSKRVVRFSRETPPWQTRPDVITWEKAVAALPAELQIQAVEARLKKLNPGIRGTIEHKIENDRVTHLRVFEFQDISPIRALSDLRSVDYENEDAPLKDLSVFRGLKLTELILAGSAISDLSPLNGMQLQHLDLTDSSRMSDLSPLKGMPLRMLSIPYTKVDNLSPLAGTKLDYLNVSHSRVKDLSPLAGMPLEELNFANTNVSDLKPLKGMPLACLDYTDTSVTDISPLRGMPLREVRCDFQTARDAAILRSIRTLETINDKPTAKFWKEFDGK